MASGSGVYPGLVRDVRLLLEDRVGQYLAELTNGSSDPLTSGELLSKAFKSYYLLKGKLDTDRLDCAVLALAKSGEYRSSIMGFLASSSQNQSESSNGLFLFSQKFKLIR